MNRGLYWKLAFEGIRKNSKLYIPYFISIIGTASIYYLLTYLVKSPALNVMGGGTNMRVILSLGKFVMIIFTVIFLFYTNAFLTKRRNKEFALYNILGMNKKNVIRVLACETIYTALIGISSSIVIGTLLSKMFEMLLLKLCGYEPDKTVYFSGKVLGETALVFVILLFILFIWTAMRVAVSAPIELLRSGNKGEKPPKANWLVAIAGLGMLGYAYYLAISIQDPVAAINEFFIAVLLVIAATYLIFIAASVSLCNLLKKNKNFYYNPKHFVPVSGMLYRMKRNGAGLATVCILSTMVLVIVSSVFSLYLGANDSISVMFPYSVGIEHRAYNIDDISSEKNREIIEKADDILKDYGEAKVYESRMVTLYGNANGNEISIVKDKSAFVYNDNSASIICVVPADDVKMNNEGVDLAKNEILLYSINADKYDSIILDGRELKVVGEPDKSAFTVATNIVKYFCIVTSDFDNFVSEINEECGQNVRLTFNYLVVNDLSDEDNIELTNKLIDAFSDDNEISVEGQAEYRAAFMELYGSLVILGFFLTVTFLSACVLIIYYKQISEGYEDAESFAIMQKVGMTKEEVRKGISSQTLITFFSPVLMAGIHLAFSFPMVQRILLIFGIGNIMLLRMVYAGCFILFSVFYYFVHNKTVKEYIEIVYN